MIYQLQGIPTPEMWVSQDLAAPVVPAGVMIDETGQVLVDEQGQAIIGGDPTQ